MAVDDNTGLLPPPTAEELEAIKIILTADPSSKYGKNSPCPKGEIADVNENLRLIDEFRVQHDRSPLSALVVNGRTRTVSSVFWETVERHNLRRDGEDDATLLMRIRASLTQEEGVERATIPSRRT